MWKHILKVVLLAGCLDIAAACIQAYLTGGVRPGTVMRYIASGWYGKQAFSGGTFYLFFGLLVHFFIVFAITTGYFLLFPKLRILQKNVLLSAILLAITAWVVTARIIVPLSNIETPPFSLSKALVALFILVCCIGLPIAYLTRRFYNRLNS